MAINLAGVQVSISESQIPDGYTRPIVTFPSQDWRRTITYSIDKASVEDVDPVVAFTALVSAIETQVLATLNNDLVPTNTVEAAADFRFLSSNQCDNASDAYTDSAEAYEAQVTIIAAIS